MSFRSIQIRNRPSHFQDPVMRPGDKPSRITAFSSNFSPSALIAQSLRNHLGAICALQYVAFSALNRSVCLCRAAITRARTAAESSDEKKAPSAPCTSPPAPQCGISIRSSSGPEIFETYRWMHRWRAVAIMPGIPKIPARAWVHRRRQHKSRRKRHEIAARAIVTLPSSAAAASPPAHSV